MRKNKLDKVIMLLSTDWFFSEWPIIGIVIDDKKKKVLQHGCREIVRKMVSGATEYWLISFSAKRTQETLSQFELLLKTSKVEGAAFKRISALTREDDASEPDS